MIAKSIGTLLFIEAACMVPSLAAALIYQDGDAASFVIAILITSAAGLGARSFSPSRTDIYARDGFAIVGFGWLLVSIFGALPFVMSGAIPSIADALFESVSGFTTTGASILRDIESLPRGILFWRGFTHWVGGMGVLALMLAILPVGASALHIMQAESTGPSTDKFVPKVGQAAKILYMIYALISAAQVLLLLAGGMSLYDALVHTFATVGTGGFSNRNLSVASYGSVYIEMVITFFMMISGVNFTLYYAAAKGGWRSVLGDEEARFYFAAIAVSVLLVSLNTLGPIYGSLRDALRYSSFQVVSIITTTGFSTADFDKWPPFSQCVLLILMLIGASAGSTGGGVKCVRVLLLAKIARREFIRLIHPNSVKVIRLNGATVERETLSNIAIFFFLYIAVAIAATLLISLDGKDLVSSSTAVLSCVGNIGPGLGAVGPMGNFADFSPACKVILSLCMITGRLEVFPILLLAAPEFWKRVNI
jgi:trk system potassium uptake protein TrkH